MHNSVGQFAEKAILSGLTPVEALDRVLSGNEHDSWVDVHRSAKVDESRHWDLPCAVKVPLQ